MRGTWVATIALLGFASCDPLPQGRCRGAGDCAAGQQCIRGHCHSEATSYAGTFVSDERVAEACIPDPDLPGPGELCERESDCVNCTTCVDGVCVGYGDLRISLLWSSDTDLDLHVATPDGDHIFFANREAGGGTLDVDDCIGSISGCRLPDRHVENVVFRGVISCGTYTVWVENFDGRSAAEYRVDVDGRVVDSWSGDLAATGGTATATAGVELECVGEESGG